MDDLLLYAKAANFDEKLTERADVNRVVADLLESLREQISEEGAPVTAALVAAPALSVVAVYILLAAFFATSRSLLSTVGAIASRSFALAAVIWRVAFPFSKKISMVDFVDAENAVAPNPGSSFGEPFAASIPCLFISNNCFAVAETV
jgi:hypothetical protein